MIPLPVPLAPPPPFPAVIAQTRSTEFVAPGVERTDIRLRTAAGPLVIHIVSIDETEPTVRLGVVLAHDRLVSPGETVSAMAARTSAVAGINADYFDIGNTNQPLNIVVQSGNLVRSPSTRVALLVGPDRRVRFSNVSMNGAVTYGGVTVPLTGVNIWQPQGGVSLMTPAYGAATPVPGVTTIPIVASGARSIAQPAAAAPSSAGPSLAFGPAANAIASPPPPKTPVDITISIDPPLEGIREAAGGGPLLVRDGAIAADPNEPAPEERFVRFPLAGAGTVDATLMLVAVDGRIPAASVGLTRPEFAALFLGLGARDAMAFDSGGSATIVARELGDERASVLNAPSDGEERPVADGVFVYSDAPQGVHPHLFARASPALALPGAPLLVQGAIVDDAGHRIRAVSFPPIVAASDPGPHSVAVTSGGYQTTVSYRTIAGADRLTIEPERANLRPGGTIALSAVAADALGSPIALGTVRWSATAGAVQGDGAAAVYHAARSDASITATAAGRTASLTARIGTHVQPLDLFGAGAVTWHVSTLPKGAAASADVHTPGELALTYDLTNARADYLDTDTALPGEPLAFSIDAVGDGSGVGLRAAFVNRFGERRALTLAKRIDWIGLRRLTITLPPDLNPPVRLMSIYVVRLGELPARTAGTIRFRDASVTLAGTR